MIQRKSLSSAGSDVDLYRQAIGELIRRDEYESWVTIHRRLAIHNSFNYFLAWHRAYLYYFEKRLQELVSGASIPYWDWARLRQVPPDFLGPGNVLNHRRTPGSIVPTLPSLQSIEGPRGLLSLATYRSFASQLENSPHNRVHNWVGADMANIAISPRDPLFWCHHAHVDHLWDRWQRSHTFDGPADPSLRLNLGGARVIPVRDVLHISDLEYEYVTTTFMLAAEEIEGYKGQARRLRLVEATLTQLEEFGSAELRLEGIPLPTEHPYEIRIFLNQPDATPETPTDDNPHFVGYFDSVVMGHDHDADHGHGHGPGVAMSDTMDTLFDVTEPLRTALAAAAPAGKEQHAGAPGLSFTLVPVGDAREFRFERATIALGE